MRLKHLHAACMLPACFLGQHTQETPYALTGFT